MTPTWTIILALAGRSDWVTLDMIAYLTGLFPHTLSHELLISINETYPGYVCVFRPSSKHDATRTYQIRLRAALRFKRQSGRLVVVPNLPTQGRLPL